MPEYHTADWREGMMDNKIEKVKKLVDMLFDYLDHADFSNGNVIQGTDEGQATAWMGIQELKKEWNALYTSPTPKAETHLICTKPDNCWGCKFADIPNRLCTLLKEVKNEIGIIHTNDVPKWCPVPSTPASPKIVCLCGSTRFSEAFQKAQFDETMAGKIVLTIGCNMKSDTELFKEYSEQELKDIKTHLDELHKRKIDIADEVLILNVNNYIGESTTSEMSYAYANNKPVRFLNPSKALDFNWNHIENRIWKDTKGGIY